ncbi:hypothetical protein Tco_0475554 [Tanacetum coccineum]
MDNRGIHNFVESNAGMRMCMQDIVTGRPYQGVGGSPKEALWEWMSDSQSTYSMYHLEGKLNFEGLGNVTPCVADVRRRKRVLCYVQGSGRRKRKKSISCGSERRDCALFGALVFTLFNPGPGSFSHRKTWDPRIKSVFTDNTLRAGWF